MREFKIPKENVICVGDETDQYFGSLHEKDPSIHYSAAEELEGAKRELRLWYKHFPYMRLATSNHGVRWLKKALKAEIPSQVIKSLSEIYESPSTWKWKDEWVIKEKSPFRVIHGLGYSGKDGARNAAMDSDYSTAIGHLHSFGGVAFTHQMGSSKPKWGLNTGCLIDIDSFAFAYGKYMRAKPTLGCGVILNEGALPLFVPMTAK